jgi:hypothetical protein
MITFDLQWIGIGVTIVMLILALIGLRKHIGKKTLLITGISSFVALGSAAAADWHLYFNECSHLPLQASVALTFGAFSLAALLLVCLIILFNGLFE